MFMNSSFRHRMSALHLAATYRTTTDTAILDEAEKLRKVCSATGMFPYLIRKQSVEGVREWLGALIWLRDNDLKLSYYIEGLGAYLKEAAEVASYRSEDLPFIMREGLCLFIQDWYYYNKEEDTEYAYDVAFDVWTNLDDAGIVGHSAASAFGPTAERIAVARQLSEWLPRILA